MREKTECYLINKCATTKDETCQTVGEVSPWPCFKRKDEAPRPTYSSGSTGFVCYAWAYWNEAKKEYRFIWPSEQCVRMCSPDGFKSDEAEGRGKVMRVKIEQA